MRLLIDGWPPRLRAGSRRSRPGRRDPKRAPPINMVQAGRVGAGNAVVSPKRSVLTRAVARSRVVVDVAVLGSAGCHCRLLVLDSGELAS